MISAVRGNQPGHPGCWKEQIQQERSNKQTTGRAFILNKRPLCNDNNLGRPTSDVMRLEKKWLERSDDVRRVTIGDSGQRAPPGGPRGDLRHQLTPVSSQAEGSADPNPVFDDPSLMMPHNQ